MASFTQRMSIQSACIQQWFRFKLLANFDFYLCLRINFHTLSFWVLILAAGGPYWWVLISQKNGSVWGPYLKAWGLVLEAVENFFFQHFANFRPRWGGERNRPLESAKKIADAATADEKEHKDGPATKRRRVQETSLDFHHEEVATNGEDSRVSSGKLNKSSPNPFSSCVEEASHPSPSNSQPAANLKERLSESPKLGEQEKDNEEKDNEEKEDNKEKEKEEKVYLDAEAVSEQYLASICGSSRVKAKIIGGLSIATKLVEVMLMCKTKRASQVKL